MMKVLCQIIMVFAFVIPVQSQEVDYQVYSTVLNDTIVNWTKDEILIDISDLDKSQDFSLIDEFTKPKGDIPDWALNYLYTIHRDDSIFCKKLLYDTDLKKSISGLIGNFDGASKLDPKKFETAKNVKSISKQKYHRYIGKKIYRNEGWSKLRKDYNSNWLFEFSKINYAGKYASLYYAIHCGGLFGSGTLIILELVNGVWVITGKLNLWHS